MVQRLAGVETDEGLVLEDDGIEKEVRTVSYVGLAEGMAVEAVDVVRASVRDGAAWGVVVARAADTPAVWEGEGPRGGGSIGFGGDAAEVFIVVPDAVVVVQLRGVLDMA